MARPLPLTLSQLLGSVWKSLHQGGLGAILNCTTSSARVAIPGAGSVDLYAVTNIGDSVAYVRGGGDDVTAGLTDYPVFVTERVFLPIFNVRGDPITYVAGITETGTAKLIVTPGYGNRGA